MEEDASHKSKRVSEPKKMGKTNDHSHVKSVWRLAGKATLWHLGIWRGSGEEAHEHQNEDALTPVRNRPLTDSNS